jgi:hypothetical protein
MENDDEYRVEKLICAAEKKFLENARNLESLKKKHESLVSLLGDTFRLSLRLKLSISIEIQWIERFFSHFLHLFYFLFETRHLILQFRRLKQILVTKQNEIQHTIQKNNILKKIDRNLNIQPILFSLIFVCKVPRLLSADPIPCPKCESLEFDVKEEQAVCIRCSCKQVILSVSSTFTDINRINLSQKYTYNKDQHFKECIMQFQGKKSKKIPSTVFSYVKDAAVLPLTVSQIINLLKQRSEFKKYADDAFYIYRELSNRPVEDISHLEGKLHQDFAEFTTAYDEYFRSGRNFEDGIPTRTNFINAQYVLCILLKKNGYRGNDSDFLYFNEKVNTHSQIISKIFKGLGWSIPY